MAIELCRVVIDGFGQRLRGQSSVSLLTHTVLAQRDGGPMSPFVCLFLFPLNLGIHRCQGRSIASPQDRKIERVSGAVTAQ